MANTQTKTRLIHDGMSGAPALMDTYGSLVKLLKSVLVDGFNEKTVSSVSIDTSKEEVKLIYTEVHGYTEKQVITLSGTGNPKLDKEHRVQVVSSNELTIIVPGIDVSSVSGTIKTKTTSLGYDLVKDDIEASGTALFRNKHESYPAILKVIDALPPNGYDVKWSKYARVVAGYRLNEDNLTFYSNEKTPRHHEFSNMEVTGNGVSGAGGIHGYLKWDYVVGRTHGTGYTESSTDKGVYPTNWTIIGDDKTFYLFIKPAGSAWEFYNVSSFGCHLDIKKKLVHNIILTGSERPIAANVVGSYKSGMAWATAFSRFHSYEGNFIYHSQFNSYRPNLKFSFIGLYLQESTQHWPQLATVRPTNPKTGELFLTDPFILDSDKTIRGYARGFRIPCGFNTDSMTFLSETDFTLATKKYNGGSDNKDSVCYVFTLKDWE